MIKKNGNLFDSTAYYLAHGVNCDAVMGAGIAKTFRSDYPENYKAYQLACYNNKLVPGGVLVTEEENGHRVVNLATQNRPGADARYDWLFASCYKAARGIAKRQTPNSKPVLAIPQIGCGIGGLQWDCVEKILETIEFIVPNFAFEVWTYGG